MLDFVFLAARSAGFRGLVRHMNLIVHPSIILEYLGRLIVLTFQYDDVNNSEKL